METEEYSSRKDLVQVVLPDSVRKIADRAFSNCSNLKTIGSIAFAYCDSLKTVYYAGTEARWQNAEILEGNAGLFCNAFSDVPSGEYYFRPVLWTAENGVAKGFPGGTFRPEEA